MLNFLVKIKDKVKNLFMSLLVISVVGMGIYGYWKQNKFQEQIAKLHNEIALNTKTIEIYKGAFEKKTAQLENLDSLLKTFELEKERDSETIKKLRKELDKRNAELVSVNRLAVKWRKAYEASIKDVEVTIDPGKDKDDKKDDRVKVAFIKDFGYIGVEGYTLTNPGFAHVKVQQNRPLLLTMALTQEKDKSWSTTVTSSEEDVEVDVKIAAVNPRVFEPSWYEKISVDFGMDVNTLGIYPYTGLSYPIGPVSVSAGLWSDANNKELGYYSTVNYSWNPFSKD